MGQPVCDITRFAGGRKYFQKVRRREHQLKIGNEIHCTTVSMSEDAKAVVFEALGHIVDAAMVLVEGEQSCSDLVEVLGSWDVVEEASCNVMEGDMAGVDGILRIPVQDRVETAIEGTVLGEGDDAISSSCNEGEESDEEEECFYLPREVPAVPLPGSTGM